MLSVMLARDSQTYVIPMNHRSYFPSGGEAKTGGLAIAEQTVTDSLRLHPS